MYYFIIYLILWLLYYAAWKISKKRKIGLTKASFLALFLTPLIACIVSLCTKKIDVTRKEPTYKQRLPYENTTAQLIAELFCYLFVIVLWGYWLNRKCFNLWFDRDCFVLAMVYLGLSSIYLAYGYFLHDERILLIEAKENQTNNNDVKEPDALPNKIFSFVPLFMFDSNKQERIEVDNDYYSRIAYYPRRVVVEQNDKGQYRVSVIDVENDKLVLSPIIMHKLTYSSIDECESMISDDDQGEYKMNVFYKNGQVDKCVICRKSNNMMFHYSNE